MTEIVKYLLFFMGLNHPKIIITPLNYTIKKKKTIFLIEKHVITVIVQLDIAVGYIYE